MRALISKTIKTLAVFTCFSLLISGCGSSSRNSTLSEGNSFNEKKSKVEEAEPLPSHFVYATALNRTMSDLQAYWANSILESHQALDKTLVNIKVEVDETFSMITVTAESDFYGNIEDGGWAGLTNPPDLEPRIFCAGQNYIGGDVFGQFLEGIFGEILGGDLTLTSISSLEMPSKGVVIRMVWNQVTTSLDKFGSEITKKKYIGTDQVGISTENLKKITDSGLADYRQLSDLVQLKYAKKSWFDGSCARSQQANNF